MLVWLGISVVLAAIIVAGPWAMAIRIFIFCLPLAGTAVAMVGQDPIVVPLVVSVALGLRYVLSLFDKSFREEALVLLSREPWLLGFIGYAVVSGFLFPRLFEGQTEVFRVINAFTILLPLTAQNVSIAQIAYLVLGGISFFAVRHAVFKLGPAPAIQAFLAQALVLTTIGLMQAAAGFAGIGFDLRWVVNNEGATIHVGAREGNFSRVTSVFLEASAFAAWGAPALALALFLMVNRVYFVTSATVVAVLGLALIVSTSATAYGGLAIVALAFTLAVLLDTDPARRRFGLALLAVAGAVGAGIVVAIFSADSGPLYELQRIIDAQIFGKSLSSSGIERGSWASASFQAGFDTFLLGVGYGALRGSGIASVLFGGVGVIGCVLIVMFIAPKIVDGFRRNLNAESAMGSASALALLPAAAVLLISSTDLGPWHLFWTFAAVGVAVRERSLVLERLSKQRAPDWAPAPETGPVLGQRS